LYIGSSVGNAQIGASDLSASIPGWYFDVNAPASPQKEGHVYWNANDHTLNIDTDIETTIQVGQELIVRVKNTTGASIADGMAVYLSGGSTEIPTVALAKADSPETSDRVIGLMTASAADNAESFATLFGKVRNIDTSAFSNGEDVYLSESSAGRLTSSRPVHPNYVIKLGQIGKSSSAGEVIVRPIGSVHDIIDNTFNGAFVENFDFTIDASGSAGTITGNLERSGGGNLTMIFSDGFTVLDTTPASSISLTPGASENPQTNFVYINQASKILEVSTSDWPTGEHIKVAELYLRSASLTEADGGALRNQNWNDHIAGTDGQGHVSHISERIRQEPARWESGAQATLTISGSPDDVFVAVTSGVVYQLHRQTFPALDMSSGDDIHIVNHPTDPFITVTNLNTQTVDTNGDTLNNKYFSFVVWGVQNKSGEVSHIMLNLPDGSYNSSADAITDADNKSVYTIPVAFNGVGFLIARFTLRLQGGVNWTLEDTQDLRGFTPNTTAGGGGGGGGTTTFTGLTDTPSAYTGNSLQLIRVNSGETALEFATDGQIAHPLGVGGLPASNLHNFGGFHNTASAMIEGMIVAASGIDVSERILWGGSWGIKSSNDVVTGGFDIYRSEGGGASDILVSLSQGRIGLLGSAITGDHLIYLGAKARAADGFRVDEGLSMVDSGQQLIFTSQEDSFGAGHTDIYSFNTDSAAYQPFNIRGSRLDFIDNSGASRMRIDGTQISLGASGGASDINLNGDVYNEGTHETTGDIISGSRIYAGASKLIASGAEAVANFLAPAGQFGQIFVASTRNSAGQGCAGFALVGRNSINENIQYGKLNAIMDTVTDGAEDGSYQFLTIQGGTLAARMKIGAGVQVGSPTGGDKGGGTINTSGDIYKNNSAYNNPDYVLENYFKGKVEKFKNNPGAREYTFKKLDAIMEYAQEHLQLPGVASASGVFNRTDVILEKIEELFIYLWEIDKRLQLIEGK
jgi:hypothetical protein